MAWWRRKTSVAKDIKGLHHDENAIDREEGLTKQFEDAQQPAKEQDNRPQKAPREGSKTVQQDAPSLAPHPTGAMRQAPDRYAAYGKVEKERKEAAAQQERAEKAWARVHGEQSRAVSREQGNEAVYGNPRPDENKPKPQKTAEERGKEGKEVHEGRAEIERHYERERNRGD